jgi:hypothetical protein
MGARALGRTETLWVSRGPSQRGRSRPHSVTWSKLWGRTRSAKAPHPFPLQGQFCPARGTMFLTLPGWRCLRGEVRK